MKNQYKIKDHIPYYKRLRLMEEKELRETKNEK